MLKLAVNLFGCFGS